MNQAPVHSKTSVSPAELHRRVAAGLPADLLDVRTPPEHASAHVVGVKLVPLDQLDPRAFLRERAGSDRPLYVFCQSGARAAKAIEKFRRAGFEGCVLVEGGTQGWIDAGLPVEQGASTVLPLMRQVQVSVGAITALFAVLALTVNPLFAIIPLLTGCGLVFAGVTGTCGMALFLAKMPWNRRSAFAPASCGNGGN